MFGKKKAHVPQKQIDSLIGSATHDRRGHRISPVGCVDGCVMGHIHSVGDEPSTLVISEKARVEGEIKVSYVVIDGAVTALRDRIPGTATERQDYRTSVTRTLEMGLAQ